MFTFFILQKATTWASRRLKDVFVGFDIVLCFITDFPNSILTTSAHRLDSSFFFLP